MKTPYGDLETHLWMPSHDAPLKRCKWYFQGDLTINGLEYHVSGHVSHDGRRWQCWPNGHRVQRWRDSLTDSARRKICQEVLANWEVQRIRVGWLEEKRKRVLVASRESLRMDIAEKRDELDLLENELRGLEQCEK
jgi:hypothetical protein